MEDLNNVELGRILTPEKLEALLRKSRQSLSAEKQWNVLLKIIVEIEDELERIFNEFEGKFASADELRELQLLVNLLQAKLEFLENDLNNISVDVELNKNEIIQLKFRVDTLEERVDALYDLIGAIDGQLLNKYIVGNSFLIEELPQSIIVIDVTFPELEGHVFNVNEQEVILFANNGIIQTENDYTVESVSSNQNVFRYVISFPNEQFKGEFFLQVVYNGVAVAANLIPVTVRRTLILADGSNEYNYTKASSNGKLTLANNGVTQTEYVRWSYDKAEEKIVFVENIFGEIYIIEQYTI